MKYIASAACAAVALALTASACGGSGGSSASSDGPYKFVAVSDVSGALAPTFGAPISMLQAYVKDLNARGGVNGRNVEIDVKDSQASAPNAATLARQAASDEDTLALLGLGLSNEMDAILPLLDRNKITGISAPSSANQVEMPSDRLSDYYWTSGLDFVNFAQPAVDFIQSKGEGLKVAVIGYDSALTHSVADQVKEALSKVGGSLVATEFLPLTQTDASASTQKVLDSHPDWILNVSMPAGMNQSFLSALKLRAPDIPLMYLANGCASSVMSLANRDNYYAICSAIPPVDSLSTTAAKMRDVATKNGFASAVATDSGDDSFSTYGWVLGRVIEETLKKCGSNCDRESFHHAISDLKLDSDGLSGAVDYSAPDRFTIRRALILSWDKEKQAPTIVKPFFDVY